MPTRATRTNTTSRIMEVSNVATLSDRSGTQRNYIARMCLTNHSVFFWWRTQRKPPPSKSLPESKWQESATGQGHVLVSWWISRWIVDIARVVVRRISYCNDADCLRISVLDSKCFVCVQIFCKPHDSYFMFKRESTLPKWTNHDYPGSVIALYVY